MSRERLAALVDRIGYKSGWSFKVGGPSGRYLCVFARCPDSMRPGSVRTTQHMFEIPAGIDVNERDWCRWVLACLLQAERHEACEFLEFDGFRPFFPNHQDEGDPYEHVERWES